MVIASAQRKHPLALGERSSRYRAITRWKIWRPIMRQVSVGDTVTLEEVETGDRRRYTLVPAAQSDVSQGLISVESPLGRAVLRHELGDEITVVLPRGSRSYEIVDVA
jgi:transcription elongation GreA/GreB family factor